jgi:hypothetical protein
MYACTGASPSALAICGLPPERSLGLGFDLGFDFGADFAAAFDAAFGVNFALPRRLGEGSMHRKVPYKAARRMLNRHHSQEYRTMNSILRLLAPAVLLASVVGCAAPNATPQMEQDNLKWSANYASDFAKLVQSYVNKEFVPSPDKATLLTQAAILAHHAQVQAKLVAAYTPSNTKESEFMLKDLKARAIGLQEECNALEVQWNVWQVQHGLQRIEDIEMVYVRAESGC